MKFKVFTILLIISSITIVIWHNNLKTEETKDKKDQFKEEFESFNDEYQLLDIPEDNPMYYAKDDEILNVLDSSGIIFFGNPKDDESRKIIPSLISTAKKTNIDQINYYNLSQDRKEEENGIIIKEQTIFYEILLERLDKEDIKDATVVYVIDGDIIGIEEEKTTSKTKELMLKVSKSIIENVS